MTKRSLQIGLPALAASAAIAGALLLETAATDSAMAEGMIVSFPELDSLVHYTTVRRGVTREHMLTSEAALAAIQAGQPVPVGTHVVLVDYQSDELYRYLVSEKLGEGTDDWGYQWFWPNGSVKSDENVAQCYACHQRSRRDREFMFTYNDARRFDTGATE